jgi:ribosomal protein S18 acetylase RimI-like enzyme
VHVRSWQDAYRGLIPDSVLRGMSVDRREAFWRGEMELGTRGRPPWVALVGDRIIGIVSAGISRDDGAPTTTGEIYALYVDPDCWRSGIGRNLLEHATRDLRQNGFTEATLWVLPSNEMACRFYERLGWRHDGSTRAEPYGGAELTEIRYRLALI